MLKACDACADMGQLQRAVLIRNKTFLVSVTGSLIIDACKARY